MGTGFAWLPELARSPNVRLNASSVLVPRSVLIKYTGVWPIAMCPRQISLTWWPVLLCKVLVAVTRRPQPG